MKKIYLILILLITISFGEEKKDNFFTKKEISEINKLFELENAKKILMPLKDNFKNSTGDKNFDKYLEIAVKDLNWKKANFLFITKYKEGEVIYNNKLMKIPTPEYEKSLEYFAKSLKENPKNILAAYQGFVILERYFLYFEGNKITSKYLKTFSEALMKNKYCLGYLYYSKSSSKRYNSNPNYGDLEKILKEGKENCIKENVHEFYIKGLLHEYSKTKVMNKIQKTKEIEKGKSN